MKTRPTAFKWTALDKGMKYLGILTTVIYIGMGIVVLVSSNELFNIPDRYSLPLGSLLLVYGLFRAYRVYRSFFKE